MDMDAITCFSCEKSFRDSEVAPVQRNHDGTVCFGCRKCIGKWIADGFLKAQFPFWARKQGLDQV